MINQLKVGVTKPVLHVPFASGEEVVNDGDLMPVNHQLIGQMGTNEPSTPCDLRGK